MKYYPIFLDLRERPCVLVGGGRVAERKALSLLEAGADVTVVSPSLTPRLRELSASGKINHREKTYDEKDLAGAYLVVAATNSPEVNTAVGRLCRKKQVLVNVATPPRGKQLHRSVGGGARRAAHCRIDERRQSRALPEYPAGARTAVRV